MKVLAMNDKGVMTYCTAPPELRGVGRCNHSEHQREGESPQEFVERVSIYIHEEGASRTHDEIMSDIIQKYKMSFNENPDWSDVIKNQIPNYFHIGKGDTYEEATIEEVKQTSKINEDGDPVLSIEAEIEFRGERYTVDMGEIPEVQDDGSIILNGSRMRVLPVLAQTKSGIVRYRDKSVLKSERGHVSLIHEVGSDEVTIMGDKVPIESVQKYLDGEKDHGLLSKHMYSIDGIDPVFYQRYPEARKDISSVLNNHQGPDHPADISWRKAYTYSDQVRFELDKQMRRMGTTFRANLGRRQKAEESGDEDQIKKSKEYPLFFQKNNTENIRSNLTSRSNVQTADNLNPLSALSQSRKISLTGPGGFNKDKAPNELRHIHESHRNLIDSMDIASGKNIGLTITLSNADLDENGFIVPSTGNSNSVSSFIPYKHHNDLNRASMAIAHMKQAVPIVGGENPRILGDSSDKPWSELSGAKMGVNLNTAYYTSSDTHEDAVIISESAAKKMATFQTTSYKPVDGKSTTLKVGDTVKRGDSINGREASYHGVVKEVKESGEVVVESEFRMGPGDKIAGRHGNKGVVSKVLPDSEMPKIDKGNGREESAEILMSQLGVVGRMNLGQVYETNGGDLNKKTKMKLSNGRKVDTTAGEQYIMRLNHIAEKKLQAHGVSFGSDREAKGLRIGEMESLIMSSTKDRREVLRYLREQEGSDARNKLDSLLKSIGVKQVEK